MTAAAAREVALVDRLYFDQAWSVAAVAIHLERSDSWVESMVQRLLAEPGGDRRAAKRRHVARLVVPLNRDAEKRNRGRLLELRAQIAALHKEVERIEAADVVRETHVSQV